MRADLLAPPTITERALRLRSVVATTLCVGAVALVVVPLASIFAYVIARGGASLSWSFLTALPKPVGDVGGGMANALVGSALLLVEACAIGLPIGVLAGVHLAESARTRFSSAVRFAADVLTGVPSISIGVFVYAIVVVAMRRFSAIAGAIALAIVLVPAVARTTEEFVRLVPVALREAALGLGVARWRVTVFVVMRQALPGIVTGVALAVARIAGETAPLLFTALGSRFFSTSLDQPIASLPVQIFTFASSPYDDWQRQAWAGALVLVALVSALHLGARAVASRLGARA
jgi:phosphate transport system permease protein